MDDRTTFRLLRFKITWFAKAWCVGFDPFQFHVLTNRDQIDSQLNLKMTRELEMEELDMERREASKRRAEEEKARKLEREVGGLSIPGAMPGLRIS